MYYKTSMEDQVKKLEQRITELERAVFKNNQVNQFSTSTIIKGEVRFQGKVYDADGTVVINS